MVNIIRNEDYENEPRNAEAGLGASGLRGAMEMKRGLLRQATKTEEEQVSGQCIRVVMGTCDIYRRKSLRLSRTRMSGSASSGRCTE